MTPTSISHALDPVEFNRIVTLDEAERLSTLSKDTIVRRYPDKIVRLSPRRVGIRQGHALMLNDESAS